MLTLLKCIKIFSDFASDHAAINSFGQGDAWEWYEKLKQNGESLTYPAMFVAIRPTQLNGNQLRRDFTVFFCMRQRKAEENESYALSDCEEMWLHLMAHLNKNLADVYVSISKSVTLEPHTEMGVDYLVAYSGTVSLVESFEWNDCIIPLRSDEPEPVVLQWFNADNCTISADNLNLIPSGGSDATWTQAGRNFYSQIVFNAGEPFDVEYRLHEDESFMGVTRSTNTGNTFADIEFATYRTGVQFQIRESGVDKQMVIPAVLNAPCRIIWDLSSLKYYHNGELIYTSLITPDTTKNFILKGTFYHNTGVSGTTVISINGETL